MAWIYLELLALQFNGEACWWGMLAGLAPGKIGLRRLINVMPVSGTLAMTAGDVCDS
jgi:hypothetical protein